MKRLVLALALAIAGGCGPNVVGIVSELRQSDRSWCFFWAGTPAFSGPFRISGSGVDGGSANCNSEGHVVNTGPVGPGGALVVPQPPRILVPSAPTFRELAPK